MPGTANVYRLGKRCLRRVVRRIQRLTGRQVAVLMYHRVAEVRCDPWKLCVSPANFDQQLAFLRGAAQVISLDELVSALRSGRIPRRAVALTFDDGYADNLYAARPLLEKHGVTATLFLCTGALDSSQEFWWDRLESLFLQPGVLPVELVLSVSGKQMRWAFDEEAELHKQAWEASCHWNIYMPAITRRQRAYCEIWAALQPLSASKQEEVMAELYRWAGRPCSVRPAHRTLTTSEARMIVERGVFQLGAHTVSHPSLPAHSPEVQEEEMRNCRACIEARLAQPVRHLSYPYGEYCERTASLAADLDFASGFTTHQATVLSKSNRYRLPRIAVGNWDGTEFARRFSAMF